MNIQSVGNDDVIEWSDYKIENIIEEDNAVIYFSVTATLKSGELISNIQQLGVLRSIWQEVTGEIKSSASYLGWLYPTHFKNFYDVETKFKLNNSDFRKQYISELLEENKHYFNLFAKRVEQLQCENL